MLPSKNLQTLRDQPHAEQGKSKLYLFDAVLKESQFLFKSEKVSVVVKDLAERVSEFNYSHHFIHEISRDTIKDPWKEIMIIVKLETEPELRLKDLPNGMILASLWPNLQLKPLFEIVIKLICVLPVLA